MSQERRADTVFQDPFSKEVWEATYKDHNDETIDDTLWRVAEAVASVEKNKELREEWSKKFYDMLSEFKTTAGGRIYSNAGTEWKGTTLMNCISAETLVLTSDGLVRADEIPEASEVLVLTENGKFEPATWKSYGVQQLCRLTFSNGETVFATEGHEWVVTKPQGGTERVTTKNLVGRNVPLSGIDHYVYTDEEEYRAGVRNGLVFGDGYTYTDFTGGERYAALQQFGDSRHLVLDHFGYTKVTYYKGDEEGIHYVNGLDPSLKDLPSEEASIDYLRGFIAGVIAADGHINRRGQVVLHTSNYDYAEKIKHIAGRAGIPTVSLRREREGEQYSRFATEDSALWRLTFVKKYFEQDSRLVLKNAHKVNLTNGPSSNGRRSSVKCVEVEKTDRVETVFCCDQPTTHTFTIGDFGLLTGNCYVSPRRKEDIDSIDGILEDVLNQCQTLKSEGGWGQNFSFIRPRGAFIFGIGVETPGAVKYMEIYDKTSDVITSGSGKKSANKKAKGKIRKGAMMGVIDVWHPDVEEFIRAKQQPGRLTKFNVSVNITDEFMERLNKVQELREKKALEQLIEAMDKWELRFPDTQFEKYEDEWDGNLKAWEEKGYPVVVYKVVSVTDLWNTIMESTYNRAEPGVLFLDRANHFLPLSYAETVVATNPCFTGDTMVMTSRGFVRIEELVDTGHYPPSRVLSSREPVGGHGTDLLPYTNARCTGRREVVKVMLSNGMEIRCTPEHLFWTGERYVEAQSLLGQTLNLTSFADVEHIIPTLSSFPSAIDQEVLRRVGLGWSPDLAFVLGWLTGDGWISGDKVGLIFGKDDADALARVTEILNSWGFQPTPSVDKNGSSTLYVHNKSLVAFFKTLGVEQTRAAGKRVPASIFKVHKELIAEFLDGLFSADGSVLSLPNGNYWVSLTSASKALLNDVQLLLLMFGITHHSTYFIDRESSFAYTTVLGEEKTYVGHPYYDLRIFGKGITAFSKNVKFTIERKQQRLVELCAKRFKRKDSIVTVIDVIPDGEELVYDITVPETHNFIANGLVVHNCGEQTLAAGGVCNLGSVNLTQFVRPQRDGFALKQIRKYVRYLVRFLDNINTLSHAPLPEYEASMRKKRRIGIGILGWGSALFMLKVRFGSEKAAQLRDKVMSTIAREAYMASIDLAIEKGKFQYCDPKKHAEGAFVKSLNLPEEYMEKLRTTGIRNSSLLSIQPTGNTSILANVVSGGLEPIFMPEYVRTVIVNHLPDEIADVTPKWYEGEWKETEMFKKAKEGDEEILRGEHNGTVYKIDKNRGLTKEVLCQDYGVRWLDERGEWDPDAEWAVTTSNLAVQDHVEDLKGFARWVDSAMSKCVAEGTLITTNKGIIPIEELGKHHTDQEGFVVPNDEYKVIDENGNPKLITSHYYGEEKPCSTVRFNNGFELTAAHTHMLKTQNGWKRVDELTVGEKVFYRTNSLSIENEYQRVPQPTFAPNAVHAKFPFVLDEDFALLLGMWVADGSSTTNSISICEKNKDVGELCEQLMVSLFGTHHSSIDDRWNVQTHFVHSRSIAAWFKEHFGHGAEGKHIPYFLLTSPHSVQRAFLEGLTLDGYVKSDQYVSKLVIFDGYARDVAEKITYMLSSMGIQYSITSRNVGLGKITYGVTAYLEDNDLIVPVEEHKQHFAVTGKTQKQTFISDETFEQLISMQPKNTYGAMMRARLRKCQKRGNFVRMSFLDKLGGVYDSNLTCVTVTDIYDAGYKKVYDIEVEDTHSYLINGIVSHNTVNVPYDYSFEKFKNIYLDAYNSGYVKGVTTYRAGTMTTVLSAKEEKDADVDDEEIIKEDVKLPDSAPSITKTLRAEGRKWYLTVVYHEDNPGRPFALFVQTNAHEKNVVADEAVTLLLRLARKKKIPKRHIDDVREKITGDSNSTKVARLLSLLLRHGVLIKNIVATLDRVESAYVGTFVFAIKKYLSGYIKDGETVEDETCMECGSTNIVYSEGCKKCMSCGSSKCG